jgi:hypothetical protein
MVTLPTTARDDIPLTVSADLVQAGAAFGDASRSLDGGFWNPADSHNQVTYPGIHTAGAAAFNNINGGLANPGRVAIGGTGVPAGGQGGNSQGGAGQSNGGQSDPRHGHGDSAEHGGRPVPSFWNFADNEHGRKDGSRHEFELMWRHA